MTERLQKVVMSAFRGVPGELVLDLGNSQSLVVFGENGTGKSTIADALEWYLTGEIELLSHEGRGHAVRHVGSRRAVDHPRRSVRASTRTRRKRPLIFVQ